MILSVFSLTLALIQPQTSWAGLATSTNTGTTIEKNMLWKLPRQMTLDTVPVFHTGDATGVDSFPRNTPWINFPNYKPWRVSGPGDWFVGLFTGLKPRSRLWNKINIQAGGANPGDTAIQVFKDGFGVFANPSSIPKATPYKSAQACLPYKCNELVREKDDHQSIGIDALYEPGLSPWVDLNSSLGTSMIMRIPEGAAVGGVNYVNVGFLLKEKFTGYRFWFLVQVFDARGFEGKKGPRLTSQWGRMTLERDALKSKIQVTNDCQQLPNPDPTDQCNKPIIFSSLFKGMKYLNLLPGSSIAQSSTYKNWKPIRFEVTGQQLKRMVQEMKLNESLRGKIPTNLSPHPWHWEVFGVSVHNETAVLKPLLKPWALEKHGKKNPPLYLGMSVRRLRLFQYIRD